MEIMSEKLPDHINIQILTGWFVKFARLFFSDEYFYWFANRRNDLVSFSKNGKLYLLKSRISMIENLAKFCQMYFSTPKENKKHFLDTSGYKKFCEEVCGVSRLADNRHSKIQRLTIITEVIYIAYAFGFDVIFAPSSGVLSESEMSEVSLLKKAFSEAQGIKLYDPSDAPDITDLVRTIDGSRDEDNLIPISSLRLPRVMPIPDRLKSPKVATPPSPRPITPNNPPPSINQRVEYFRQQITNASHLIESPPTKPKQPQAQETDNKPTASAPTNEGELVKIQRGNKELWEMLKKNEQETAKLVQDLETIRQEKAEVDKRLEAANKKYNEVSARVLSQAMSWQEDSQKIEVLTMRIANKDVTISRLQRELSASAADNKSLAILLQQAQNATIDAEKQKQFLIDQLQVAQQKEQNLLKELNQATKARHVFQACSIGDIEGALVTIIETTGTGLPPQKKITVNPALLQ